MTGDTDPTDGGPNPDSLEDRPWDSDEGSYPRVPLESLESGGWSLRDTRIEVRARLAGVVARAHELRFEDDQLREQIRSAGGPDHLWRLFYATRLTFSPSLPPGIGPAMALPKVRSAAREEFADQLRDEGLVDVEAGDDDRIEVATGTRAKRTHFEAALPVETPAGEIEIPMEGWIAIWHDEAILLAGGLHPTRLTDVLEEIDVEFDPATSREELRTLLQHVSV
ncbi:hypothetical protein HLRTI_000153 [Halorhabdus tiamatea SARL4B]|uniref:Uncharacterized protein n=1 Tax=Halorhabdus tiamatea SARL4B TaxID=1033806 RepID=F7PN69_9EURY|nr:hypothetical protein [Halorhabdus tiamatea]ERJ07774.1 hypothetical protein HLRTI_000153 [Halorhabdus tiamatea SARL4B]CCQ32567.1 conserved hypothetical protein [Halorhabdus tiamatea SARL4B]